MSDIGGEPGYRLSNNRLQPSNLSPLDPRPSSLNPEPSTLTQWQALEHPYMTYVVRGPALLVLEINRRLQFWCTCTCFRAKPGCDMLGPSRSLCLTSGGAWQALEHPYITEDPQATPLQDIAERSASHPTQYTLHPTPRTPHPTPHTLQPTPCTLHPPTLDPSRFRAKRGKLKRF